MMIKKLPLQDLILAVLAFDQKQGAEIAEMIEPTHFDSFLCEFARHLLGYRRRYGRPPSDQVLRDLAERSSCGNDEQAAAIMDRLKTLRNPDAKYVTERVDDFINSQQIKGILCEASERYEQGGEHGRLVSDIRAILAPAINTPPRTKEDSIMSVAEFLRLPLHDPEMLLPPWLEAESTTMLHGPAGSRKTLALMELALGLATAQPCFAGRWTPTRPVRTLYIDGELSPGQLRRRWRRFPILDGAPLQVLSRRWARSQGVNWPSLYAREGQAMLIELSHAIGPR